MAQNLGGSISANKSYLFHPSIPNQKIFIILDAAHMHKLVRNGLPVKVYYMMQKIKKLIGILL